MKLVVTTTIFSLTLFGLLTQPVFAQGFGSDVSNYDCARFNGDSGVLTEKPDGSIVCVYGDLTSGDVVERPAILKPPRLQILQIWFVRLIYVIWGVSGVVFTFILISIGLQYILSFGNIDAVGQVIKRFQKFVVGLALVFLSYPLLATFFNLLPLRDDTCYSDINMPGFQFFFPSACIVEEQPTTP